MTESVSGTLRLTLSLIFYNPIYNNNSNIYTSLMPFVNVNYYKTLLRAS